jgi:hypothetical protein
VKHNAKGLVMTDQVDTKALKHAIDSLAQAVTSVARQSGDVLAVRRLLNDVERIKIDAADCERLPAVAVQRTLEVIPDTPYDQSLWRDVDDEGLGGFHRTSTYR